MMGTKLEVGGNGICEMRQKIPKALKYGGCYICKVCVCVCDSLILDLEEKFGMAEVLKKSIS